MTSRPPVLVTGATGFIGREVVTQLLGAERPVIALARLLPRCGVAPPCLSRDVMNALIEQALSGSAVPERTFAAPVRV